MQLFSWSLQPILRLEVLHIPSVSVLPAAAGPDRAEFELEGVKSLVVVPLVYRGSAIGFLGFDSLREERTWSDESITLLKMVSDILVSALERRHVAAAADSAVAVERMRLARDLHDSVTQTLFSASLIAEVLPRLWERKPDEARRRLEELRQLTRGALAEMRTLLLELRPSALTEVPLAELLRHLTEAATGRLRVPVTLEVLGECDLPPDVRVALYRIAQEALNNIVKHAAAGRASVSLRCGHGGVELVIGDDGRGFDARAISADHLGLNIMRERAEAIRAGLTIDSKAGAGTRVLVVWRRPSVEGGIDGRSAEYSRADR
jgi:signal transduction histidine kinase